MKPEGNIEGMSRRRFLGNVVKGIGGIVTIGIASPLIGYFLSPIWKKTKPSLTPIGAVSQIPEGKPTYITYELRISDGWYINTVSQGVWAVNKGDENITIFDPRCTHLNCPYYWDDAKQVFSCPCHGGVYSIDGKVLAGPPPRSLDRMEYFIQQGTILLSGKIIRGTPV
jgi:menaquinol-cytochrome c reductase iron-sulfur subunit